MDAILALLLIADGKATAYSPGVMDVVVENRVRWGQVDLTIAHEGFVALADPQYLGEQVWIEWSNGEMTGPYLVADCGATKDQDYLREIDFAVDLSHELREYLPDNGVKVYVNRGKGRVSGIVSGVQDRHSDTWLGAWDAGYAFHPRIADGRSVQDIAVAR